MYELLEQNNLEEKLEGSNETLPDQDGLEALSLQEMKAVYLEGIPEYEKPVIATCDPFSVAEKLDWQQGDNVYEYEGTCGLTSIANVLQLSGINATESEVVGLAINERLCQSPFFDPTKGGSTTEANMVQLLSYYGISANAYDSQSEYGAYDEIANALEDGKCIMMTVDSGQLWDDPTCVTGSPNHAITLTSPVRDAETGNIVGFYVCDSGRGLVDPEAFADDKSRFLSIEELNKCYADIGGSVIVTSDSTRQI